MSEAIAASVTFLYGSALIWGAFQITRLLVGLVRPARPPVFNYLRATAVWSVGASTTLVGLAMVVQAMMLISGGPLAR